MFKIVLIILALIGLVGTTTHYALANNMGGPAMGPADSGSSSGGSSSQGPSDTTTSPGGPSGGGSRPDTTLSNTDAGGWMDAGAGGWHHHHGWGSWGSGGSNDHWGFPESWSHPRGWEQEPSTQVYHHHMGGMYGPEEYPTYGHWRHHHYDALIGDAIIRDPTTGAPSYYNAIPNQK